jgi:hypothetical protein
MSATDPIAAFDQAQALLDAAAPVLGRYFRLLIAQGFERAEAMDLVADLQAELLGFHKGPGEDDA